MTETAASASVRGKRSRAVSVGGAGAAARGGGSTSSASGSSSVDSLPSSETTNSGTASQRVRPRASAATSAPRANSSASVSHMVEIQYTAVKSAGWTTKNTAPLAAAGHENRRASSTSSNTAQPR